MKSLYVNEAGKDEGRLTEDGQSFDYFVKDLVKQLVEKANEHNYSLREVAVLVASELDSEISRAIISRRRPHEAAARNG